jgi:hypothetical protein
MRVEDGGANIPVTLSFYPTSGGGRQDADFTVTSEWQRFDGVFTNIIAGAGNSFAVIRSNTTSRSILAWGAQLEEGSYATSYIPTSGTIVTRAAETCTGAGNAQVFNDSEGVLFLNVAALANDGTYRIISISNSNITNRILIYYYNITNAIFVFVTSSSSLVVNQNYVISDVTDFNKLAFKWKLNDFSLFVNGVKVLTDTLGAVPTGLVELAFDDGNGSSYFYGKTKQIGVYDTALTDEELETLTT